MQTANGNLVIIGLHTACPQVFWNGVKVDVVKVYAAAGRVYLTVPANASVPEGLQQSGVKVRKVKK